MSKKTGGLTVMYYDDDSESGYAIEQFDHVDVVIDGLTHEGQIKALHPKLKKVTVRYRDCGDIAKSTGEPKSKTARVPISDLELIRRDG